MTLETETTETAAPAAQSSWGDAPADVPTEPAAEYDPADDLDSEDLNPAQHLASLRSLLEAARDYYGPLEVLTRREMCQGSDLDRIASTLETVGEVAAVLRSLTVRLEDELRERLEEEGLNPSGETIRRGAFFQVSYRETPRPVPAADFAERVDLLEQAAIDAGFAAEAAACISRTPSVNRTKLRSLVKAGGEVARIAESLWIPGEPKRELKVSRLTGPIAP